MYDHLAWSSACLPPQPRRISLHDAACDLDPFTVCELDYYGHSTCRISGGKIVGSDLYHLLSGLLECRNRPAGSRIDDYVRLNDLFLISRLEPAGSANHCLAHARLSASPSTSPKQNRHLLPPWDLGEWAPRLPPRWGSFSFAAYCQLRVFIRGLVKMTALSQYL